MNQESRKRKTLNTPKLRISAYKLKPEQTHRSKKSYSRRREKTRTSEALKEEAVR